jgi:hypothetical protein
MSKYLTRIAFIISFLSLTSCGTCNPTPQLTQEKQPISQEEKLKSEIKELEIRRKQQITQLMDAWFQNTPLQGYRVLLKQGDIEEIYKWFTNKMTKEEIEEKLRKLRDKAKNENEDYNTTNEEIAILGKDLYKIYESHFLKEFINKNKKQEVEVYFKELEEKEKNVTLNDGVQKKQLQVLRNWKDVGPILKLEQAKREALKKLQEAKA